MITLARPDYLGFETEGLAACTIWDLAGIMHGTPAGLPFAAYVLS
jgi:hypothetical protein